MSDPLDKAHDPKKVDITNSNRGLWLIPKYVSDRWESSSGDGQVGTLIVKKPSDKNGKSDVRFHLKDELVNGKSGDDSKIPKELKFNMNTFNNEHFYAMSQTPCYDASGKTLLQYQERVAITGRIKQKADGVPMRDDNTYLKMKSKQVLKRNEPIRKVIQTNEVCVIKPLSRSSHDTSRKDTTKKVRGEKDQVQERLFAAFEKHQYYNIKDLQTLTQQPIAFLKEILNELCIYNTKAPHKNMWELKPEFRHYSK
ncbi:DgyrCDS2813 [Dimorphilus gyrociliatus]|uniref:General transcription factor IIF subunit 2 n=1 Tax=Dimorphilus gyrociliatus TaxID=2664684 RepID=A0A7I8VCM1_9ANNE|nr:DgyrCDS2813 [Dimorphilus gyrociliatus]